MSKGLEALNYIKGFANERTFNAKYDNGDIDSWHFKTIGELFPNEFETIEKELKDREKILARLQVVQMKINAQLKEYGDSIEHFEEDDYMFNFYRIRVEVLNEISDLLKEVFVMKFRIKPNVDPKALYDFGFIYRGNWARGELYQKEIPELKGKGNGISINFDLGAEIHFITPYMDIEYPNIEDYIQDLIKAGYAEEFE